MIKFLFIYNLIYKNQSFSIRFLSILIIMNFLNKFIHGFFSLTRIFGLFFLFFFFSEDNFSLFSVFNFSFFDHSMFGMFVLKLSSSFIFFSKFIIMDNVSLFMGSESNDLSDQVGSSFRVSIFHLVIGRLEDLELFSDLSLISLHDILLVLNSL